MINYTWEQANKNGFYFKTNGKRCIITKYKGNLKDVIIPDTIDNKPIKAIENNAFKSTNIESITIPDSVTSIGKCAFEQTLLKSIRLPNSIKSIGDKAFSHSLSLKDVFCDKKDLSKVKFGEDIFNCTPYGTKNELVILNNILLKFNQGINHATEVYIPYNVDVIERWAFKHSGIKKIFLPNKGFLIIRNEAFAYCYNFNDISFYGDNSYSYVYTEMGAFRQSKLLLNMIDKHTIRKINRFPSDGISFLFNNDAVSFAGDIATMKCKIYYTWSSCNKEFTIYLPSFSGSDSFFNISYSDHVPTLTFNVKSYDDYFKNEKRMYERDKVLYSYYRIKLSNDNNLIKTCMSYLSTNIKVAIQVFVSLDDAEALKQLIQWNILKDKRIKYAISKAEKYNSQECLDYLKSLDT